MNADETIKYLRKSCNGCDNGCCEFEVLGKEAADLIESLTSQLAERDKRIKELERERRWIRLNEKPEGKKAVLVNAPTNKNMYTAYKDDNGMWRTFPDGHGIYEPITHYMELPQPPKESEEEE